MNWDPAKHPRKPRGAPDGGQFADVYHVTYAPKLEQILKKGIRANKTVTGDRAVYVWSNKKSADFWATQGAGMIYDHPVRLHARVPLSVLKSMEPDPVLPGTGALRGRVSIKPEWIVSKDTKRYR